MTISLTKFEILTTGVDGGHKYVISWIDFDGSTRKLVVFFADKQDERKLAGRTEITVEGELVDEPQQSLNLLNSRLVD
jgi:hypothetical protein